MADSKSDPSFIPSLPLSTSLNLQSLNLQSFSNDVISATTSLDENKNNNNNDTESDNDNDDDIDISFDDTNGNTSSMISSKTKRKAYLVSEQREIIGIYDSFDNKIDAINHIQSMNGYHEIYERKIKRWKSGNKIMGKPISQEFEDEILRECVKENSNFIYNVINNKKINAKKIKQNAMKVFDREYYSKKFNQLIKKWYYDNKTYNLQFTSKWIKGFLKRLKDKLESDSSLLLLSSSSSSLSQHNTSSSSSSQHQHNTSSFSIEHEYNLKQSSSDSNDIDTIVSGDMNTWVEPVLDFIYDCHHQNHQQQHHYHRQHQIEHHQHDHHEHQHQQHDHHHHDHLEHQHQQHDHHHHDHLGFHQSDHHGQQHQQHDHHHHDHIVCYQQDHQKDCGDQQGEVYNLHYSFDDFDKSIVDVLKEL